MIIRRSAFKLKKGVQPKRSENCRKRLYRRCHPNTSKRKVVAINRNGWSIYFGMSVVLDWNMHYTDVRTGKFVYLRDEIQELLEDLRQGKIKGVVAKEIARTRRDIMDVLELKREITSHGGFFIAIKENYDSRTDDDEFLLVLYAALARKEQKTTKVTQLIKDVVFRLM